MKSELRRRTLNAEETTILHDQNWELRMILTESLFTKLHAHIFSQIHINYQLVHRTSVTSHNVTHWLPLIPYRGSLTRRFQIQKKVDSLPLPKYTKTFLGKVLNIPYLTLYVKLAFHIFISPKHSLNLNMSRRYQPQCDSFINYSDEL